MNSKIKLALFVLLAFAFKNSKAQNCPSTSTNDIIYNIASSSGLVTITTLDITAGTTGVVYTPPSAGQGVSGVNANAIGWSVSQAKFYYFAAASGTNATLKFVSYDPATNTAVQLANPATASSINFTRGVVTSDGNGFYGLTETSLLYYYDVATNTWTLITNKLVDQNGTDIGAYLSTTERSGDIAIDGSGNLWILSSEYGTAGGGVSPVTHSIYKISGPLPKTPIASLTVAMLSTGVQNPGDASFTGIAFNRNGQIYLGSPLAIYKVNNDFSITQAATSLSGGSDVSSCALPLTAFPQNITGSVFNDANGLTDNTVNGTGTNAGGLNAVLIDRNNGKVVGVATVAANGTYSFPNTSAGIYTIMITTANPTAGTDSSAVAKTLPAGWVNTGENVGTAAGSDGTPNGKLSITVAGAPVVNANFGIERTPESYNETLTAAGTPGALTNLGPVPMEGSDPEDAATKKAWTGSNLIISTLPTNGFELKYNGVLIKAGDTIKNYTPSLLTIQATGNSPQGIQTTNFNYAVLDAAGIADPTPATYTVNWALPLPAVFGSISAQLKNGALVVNWTSLSEENVSHYDVEISKDGINFTKLGTVVSSAQNGNSSTPINYTFTKEGAASVLLGASIFALLLFAGRKSKFKTAIALSALITVVSVAGVSCSKSKDAALDSNSKLFVRIAQYDKNNPTAPAVYSKIVQVVQD